MIADTGHEIINHRRQASKMQCYCLSPYFSYTKNQDLHPTIQPPKPKQLCTKVLCRFSVQAPPQMRAPPMKAHVRPVSMPCLQRLNRILELQVRTLWPILQILLG